MADSTKKNENEPAPRPPRQPDPKLITYLERSQERVDTETRAEPPQGW